MRIKLDTGIIRQARSKKLGRDSSITMKDNNNNISASGN